MTDRQEKARRPRSVAVLTIALLAGTALAGFAPAAPGWAANESGTNTTAGTTSVNGTSGATAPAPVNSSQAMSSRLPDFVALVKQEKPAVVSVTNYLKTAPAMADEETPGNPQLPFPFNQFPFNQMPGNGSPEAHAVEARGSGFIINPDGVIITNNHVINNARRLEVTLDDGTKLPAKVVGADPRTDIAVLKVDAHHPLPYLKLGNSQGVQPGEWVIAIGNPFGLSETVTAGIVSALGRNIGAGPYDQFIQVDAPINQGNSGGPLITQDGKVVGMTTAILSPSGGSIGIGFAIPSNLIEHIAQELEQAGHVTRGYLGVEAQPVTNAIAKALNLPSSGGALVAAVEPNTPAAKAGVQPGDVIRSVDGRKIASPRSLADDVADIKPGSQAQLDVVRDGHQQTLGVQVAEMPGEQQVASGTGAHHQHEARLGLALGPVSPGIADQLNLPDGTRGALVTQVQPGSPADQAGIQPGDVIVGVGTHSVQDPAEAMRAVRESLHKDDTAVALRIIRNGQPAFVAVNLNGNQSGNG